MGTNVSGEGAGRGIVNTDAIFSKSVVRNAPQIKSGDGIQIETIRCTY